MTQPPQICLFFAVKQEAQFLHLPAELRPSVTILFTGMGHENAATAAHAALNRSAPHLVLTCGFAGALEPSLPHGQIIFDTDPASPLHSLLIQSGALPVHFHCAQRVAIKAAEKRALRLETGAHAVEMESSVIRQICKDRDIPSATIRAVSDIAEEDLPLDFNRLLTSSHSIHFPKLAWSLLASPNSIPGLLKLREHTVLASRNLAEILQKVLPAIHLGKFS